MEYEQPWNMGKILLEHCECRVNKLDMDGQLQLVIGLPWPLTLDKRWQEGEEQLILCLSMYLQCVQSLVQGSFGLS